MSFASRAARLLATTVLLAACGPSSGEAPPVAGRAAPSVMPFERYGYPGPWWREGATQSDFDDDLGDCRSASHRAREWAGSELRKDAAYRAFLDCMQERRWSRRRPLG